MADMSAFEQLDSLISEQKNRIHALNETLKEVDIGAGGVGETIEPGTQYEVSGVTYTAGVGTEIFNNYEDDNTDLRNKAAGKYTHVEGSSNGAYADYAHAEGNGNTVAGIGGHAEGLNSTVTGQYSHAEGHTFVAGNYSHGEGYNHSEGGDNYGVVGNYAHVEGGWNFVSGNFSHAEGYGQQITANYSHAEGYGHQIRGAYDHAEGYGHNLTDSNGYSHAEGYNNECHSQECHIENGYNHIFGGSPRSHCEGEGNSITGSWEAHIEGSENSITGSYRAHCEGYTNTILGSNESHVEGDSNHLTSSNEGHLEGASNSASASAGVHVEGSDNTVTNSGYAHAEGSHGTITNGSSAHTEGYYCTASANFAHAQNDHTTASATGATAMGNHTISAGNYQLTLGSCNVSNNTSVSRHDSVNNVDYSITKFPFIIGNGHDDWYVAEYRSDAFKVDCEGKIYVGSDTTGVDVSGLNVTSSDNKKVLTASYQNGVGTYSWQDAPESGVCVVHTYTDTSLPAKVVLDNNNEYRYLSLTNANSLTISIETIDTTKSFYSTIVLHNVTSTNSLSTFVTVSGDSVISNIVFLNENNVDLSTADTAELLFFTNGMSNTVMCIAYAYGTSTP